jgi:hypothetical protein
MATVNYAKPLSGGRDTRHRTVLRHLREWNRNVLEALFGRKFSQRNIDDAFLFVGFIEIGALLGKEHVHLLIRVPKPLTEIFEQNATLLWRPKQIAPVAAHSSSPLQSDVLIRRIYDTEGAVRYCTKDVRDHADNIVFSNEFRVITVP